MSRWTGLQPHVDAHHRRGGTINPPRVNLRASGDPTSIGAGLAGDDPLAPMLVLLRFVGLYRKMINVPDQGPTSRLSLPPFRTSSLTSSGQLLLEQLRIMLGKGKSISQRSIAQVEQGSFGECSSASTCGWLKARFPIPTAQTCQSATSPVSVIARSRAGERQSPAIYLEIGRDAAYSARRRSLATKASRHAGVAELVDAADSKSASGNRLSVRVRPPVPKRPGAALEFPPCFRHPRS